MKLAGAMGTIGGLTMVSRVLGFLREMVAARVLGAGPAAEVFALAFLMPNLFRRLFGEGAFSSGFVPLFSKRLRGENGMEEAKAFAEEILAVFAPVLILITLVLMVSMEGFVGLLTDASWKAGDGRTQAAIELTRITMPYMVMICLVSLASGVVNSLNRFAAAAFAPALLNFALVGALLLFHGGGMETARAMAWAVLAGGVLQIGLLWYSMVKAGVRLRFRAPRLTAAVKELVVLILPASLAGGIYYISQFFYARFATGIDGALVYLGQADRLNQLPLAIIGSALGTAILPAVSRAIAADNGEEAATIQGQAVDLGMLLTLPATIALCVAAHPIAALLYQGGRFTAEDAANTGLVLSILASGLPAYVGIKVLVPGFYARQQMWTPVLIGVASLIIGVSLNFILVPLYGLAALPFSTSFSAWLNMAALYVMLHARGHFRLTGGVAFRVTRQLVAALAMGAVLWALQRGLGPLLPDSSLGRLIMVVAIVPVGVLVYFGLGWVIGAIDKDDVLVLLRRKKAA
ncbi:MAG: murein biosynthesis integral membrane protein MurJ [Sphingomonadales bacterium]|jgi:putative peptidoglycan lipid II flippase|nr:murein biosynthesis integral membrane protein MurJ [Sphingomonadales bacterium]